MNRVLILGNSLLTARSIPASGEGDLKTCLAMKIMDALGAGGSYTEFYAMDFVCNFILMGHDGPGNIAISDGKPILRGLGLYHGERGRGVSVEFKVRQGPITILGMTQTADGGLKMAHKILVGSAGMELDRTTVPAIFSGQDFYTSTPFHRSIGRRMRRGHPGRCGSEPRPIRALQARGPDRVPIPFCPFRAGPG